MTHYIVANWKMNGSLESAHDFCTTFTKFYREGTTENTVVLCPSSPYLTFVNGALTGTDIALGAQDCSGADKGAFTGETSAQMLGDVGCDYVIIGHSERRQHHKEPNELLRSKIQRALDEGLNPIFCIGESEADFEAGKTQDILKEQLKALSPFENEGRLIVAYEPVWAIGTGKVASLDDIQTTCAFLKEELVSAYDLAAPILYGGSVKANNAKEIMDLEAVDGVLVGGASLDPQEFWNIAK